MERGSGEVGGARANTTTKTGNDEEDRRNQKDFFSLFVSFSFLFLARPAAPAIVL